MIYRTERSTDQVIKPINLEALSKWVPAIPMDVRRDMRAIAPMLQKLGYDPFAYPPNYGKPDKQVADNTAFVKNNLNYWRLKGEAVYRMTKPPVINNLKQSSVSVGTGVESNVNSINNVGTSNSKRLAAKASDSQDSNDDKINVEQHQQQGPIIDNQLLYNDKTNTYNNNNEGNRGS